MTLEPDIEQFDAWERHTRGYDVWPYAVELEPAFESLLTAQPASRQVDDGRRPGIWGQLFGKGTSTQATPPPKRPSATARHVLDEPDLVELQLVLPESFVVRSSLAAELFGALHNFSHLVSYELIGLPEGIVLQFCCSIEDRAPLLESLRAFFPEVKVKSHAGFLAGQWNESPRYGTLIDFGLQGYFFHTLKTAAGLETDPLIGVVGALNTLPENELAVLQVMFRPSIESWGTDLWAFVERQDDGKEVLPLIRRKFSERPHAAVIRVATLADTPRAAFTRARIIGNAVLAATQAETNGLIPLDNEGYPDELHAEDFLRRQTHRSGMILSPSELLTLVHLPSASVRSDRLLRQDERTVAAPMIAMRGEMLLGVNQHDGEEAEVRVSAEQRLKHSYVVGASGTGKSTLLLNMILQDIERGHGVAVLDPHGDLVEDVLARLPESRHGDVVVLDPSDTEYPVGFNVLSARSDLERTLLSSDLVGVFRRMTTSWGDQMTAVLGNAIQALLESPKGGTLLDLRRFLTDEQFRTAYLPSVTDHEVVYFWGREYPMLKGFPQAPLLTRLDAFLRPKAIRHMVAQRSERFDLRSLMDRRKIVLAKLSQGAIGEENSYLLGSLLMAKIAQAAASRQEQSRESRVPFFVYIDEFQNYVTPSLAQLLSGVRKYGVGLTLAHQDLRQIRSRSEDVAAAVLGNAYTRVVFRVGEQDARALAEGLSHFEAKDLQNLGTGEAIVRLERSDFDFNLKTHSASEVDQEDADERRATVLAMSRAKYSSTREEVEEILAVNYPAPEAPEPKPVEKESPAPPKRSSRPSPAVEQPEPRPDAKSAEPPPSPAPAPRPAPPQPMEPPLPGRGGPQHKYLQALLKRSAEDRGFRVTLEKRVLEGAGHIDVALERDGLSVGCEISVTTPSEHESQNLSKCIAAGFDYAVLVSSEKKTLSAVERQMRSELSDDQAERLRFITPEGFSAFLDELDALTKSRATTVRGYRVNVKYRRLSDDEKKEREALLADVIAKSMRRTKKK